MTVHRPLEGVEIRVDQEAVHVVSETSLICCASAIVGGGIIPARHILNMHVPKGYSTPDPGVDLRAFAKCRGIVEPFVGMMTAAWTEKAAVVTGAQDGITVTAVVTAGLSNPVAAGVSPVHRCEASTINTILLVDADLPPAALVNSIITATEAKTLVLGEAKALTPDGRPASGTSTDAVVVAATGRGRRVSYAGPVSDCGWLLARATRLALAHALG